MKTKDLFLNFVKKPRNRLYFATALMLLALEIRMNVGINAFSKAFYDSLVAYDVTGLPRLLQHYALLLLILVAASGLRFYLTNRLSLYARTSLVNVCLTSITQPATPHRTNTLDNIDQRISDDTGMFCELSLDLFFTLFEASLKLISFGWILWHLSGALAWSLGNLQGTLPGYLFWCAILYASLGTAITAWIAKPLIALNYQQQQKNADFRYSLIQWRNLHESAANCIARFEPVVHNKQQWIAARVRLLFFTKSYDMTTFIIGFLLAIPLYLHKTIALGTLMQISGAFSYVIMAASILVDQYDRITEWRATKRRLQELSVDDDNIGDVEIEEAGSDRRALVS